MAAVHTSQELDFTNYKSAFAPLKLEAFPECVRATVERMRHLRTHIPQVDERSVLGEGKFGIVFKGSYVGEKQETVLCAVKVFFRDFHYEREVSMNWKCAGVSAVVPFHGFFAYKQEKYNAIVIDYIAGKTMAFPDEKLTLPEEIRDDSIELAWQLFKFLSEIQKPAPNRKKGMIHADLFFWNIFWVNRKLTIIDLGMMAEMGNLIDPVVQCPLGRAPEIFLNQLSECNPAATATDFEPIRYDQSIDVWSIGVLIHKQVTANLLVPILHHGPSTKEQAPYGHFEIASLVRRLGAPSPDYLKTVVAASKFFDIKEDHTFHLKPKLSRLPKVHSLDEVHQSENSSPEILALLRKIFVWDPKQRISVEEALKDPLFKEKH